MYMCFCVCVCVWVFCVCLCACLPLKKKLKISVIPWPRNQSSTGRKGQTDISFQRKHSKIILFYSTKNFCCTYKNKFSLKYSKLDLLVYSANIFHNCSFAYPLSFGLCKVFRIQIKLLLIFYLRLASCTGCHTLFVYCQMFLIFLSNHCKIFVRLLALFCKKQNSRFRKKHPPVFFLGCFAYFFGTLCIKYIFMSFNIWMENIHMHINFKEMNLNFDLYAFICLIIFLQFLSNSFFNMQLQRFVVQYLMNKSAPQSFPNINDLDFF